MHMLQDLVRVVVIACITGDGPEKYDDDPERRVPQRTFAPRAPATSLLQQHVMSNSTTCFMKLMYVFGAHPQML